MINRFSLVSLRVAAPGLSALLLATSLVLGGCSDDGISGEGGSGTTASSTTGGATDHGEQGGGTLSPASGKTAPTSADVQVIWSVSSGSPDYSYAFGKGTLSGATYDLTLADPPADALNSSGIGVGILVLLPAGGAVAGGKLADLEAVEAKALGASGLYAIIYKKAGATGLAWSGAFSDGYSCAKGVKAAEGAGFDTFEPIDCAKVVITVDALKNIEFTNWT